eukprot:369218-Pleurochrysis_carterae.AAC.1
MVGAVHQLPSLIALAWAIVFARARIHGQTCSDARIVARDARLPDNDDHRKAIVIPDKAPLKRVHAPGANAKLDGLRGASRMLPNASGGAA